jgi:hypothetical protein
MAVCGIVVDALTATRVCAEPAPFMMRAVVDGQTIEGQPLIWNQQNMLLMGRDGVLHDFKPTDAKEAVKVGRGFVGYTTAEMAAVLRAEFDRSYEVVTTSHFVVVHPVGGWREWPERLEFLFGSFTNYMSARGSKLHEPATPLVAVVYRTQQEYYAHAKSDGAPVHIGTLGHYDAAANRLYMFNGSEDQMRADWGANAQGLIHEATHQTAYNVGVHSRLTEQPRWAVEGLAMLFEAPGIWNASAVRNPVERLNRGRLDYFKESTDQRSPEWLTQLVASDELFRADPLTAYSNAWTLTFYLSETMPQQYSAYLARVASREPFATYTPTDRMRDFTAAFGGDLELLKTQLEQVVEELP